MKLIASQRSGHRRVFSNPCAAALSAALLVWIAPVVALPGDSPTQFQLADGDLLVELVAAEPLIVDPVAMAFDDRGRLFVVEMRGFQQGPDAKGIPGLGRVRMLEDRDGDGVFDHATTFADGLYYATAVLPTSGGVLVGCAPDILFYRDADGDGVADQRQVIFTGFGTGNHEQLVNTFQWGLDNWIRACTGGNGGTISSPADGMEPLNVNGRNLRMRPEPSAAAWQIAPGHVLLEPTSGPGQFGLTANDFGDYFTCDNSHHIRHIVLPDEALRRNPHLIVTRTFLDIPDHGAACKIGRISPMEQWRVVRTQQRAAAADASRFPATELVPGGYITAACSLTFFDGDGLGEGYVGNMLVCDAANNLIHRDRLESNGPTYVARRVETEAEFLASKDNWFRPTALATGPDGCLYVADMRRLIIETPASIPPEILRTIDLDAGEDQGRIWRIRHRSVDPKPLLADWRVDEPGDGESKALLRRLVDRNGWWRRRARQSLVESHDTGVVPALHAVLVHAPEALARLNALAALDGLGALTPDTLQAALADGDARVRVRAVQACAGQAWDDQEEAAAVQSRMTELADDASPRVRFELALAAWSLPNPLRVETLMKLIAAGATDEWSRAAVLSSAAGVESELWHAMIAETHGPLATASPGGAMLIRELNALIASGASTDALADHVVGLTSEDETAPQWWHVDAVTGVAAGMGRHGGSGKPVGSTSHEPTRLGEAVLRLVERSPSGPSRQAARSLLVELRWDQVPEPLARLIVAEAEISGDFDLPVDERISAARVLILDAPAAPERLAKLLAPYEPVEVQLAGIHALGELANAAAAAVLLDRGRWRTYTPRVQSAVLDAVLSQKAMWAALLTSIGEGDVPAWAIDAERRKRLMAEEDPVIRERAAKLLGEVGETPRQEVYERYRKTLNASGDIERGREVFKTNCSACHRLEGVGQVVGPDLQPLRTRLPEALLADILMPSQAITAGYSYYSVDTADGESLTGVIASETPNAITLRQREGVEHVILREQIDDLYASSLSMMPENFDHLITPAQMNDLLAFLHQPPGGHRGGTEKK